MVSVGTILSVGFAAAIIAGGYALYRNADKIGGALSRGVETNLTQPLGNYFDNLWGNVTTSSINAVQTAVNQTYQQAQGGFVDAWNKAVAGAGTLNPIYPWLTQQPQQQQPPIEVTPLPPVPTLPPPLPPVGPIAGPKAGFYYVDYTGSKYDTQWELTSKQAAQAFETAGADLTDAFLGLQYLGKSKLGPAGFQLFGKSKGYL